MNNHAWRVLLVDDERSLREPLATFLREEYNLDVDTAASRSGAWQYVLEAEEPYDVALIDDMLLENETDPEAFPTAAGIDLMTQIKQHTRHTEYIIFTGWSGAERGIEALRAGAYRYMNKPFDHEELAMTIQMAAEHHQLIKEYELAEQQKKWLQTFMKIGQVTTSIRSFDEVLAEVHLQVGKLMDASEMDIVLYDTESQMLYFELCYDRDVQQEKWERPFGEGFTEWVITQNQPMLIRHFNQEKKTLPAMANIVFFDDKEDEITQSYLGVPLVARNEVIGVINVQSYEPNQFDETDLYVLSAVASQVAVAINNARLFSNLNEEREHRQALLQSSLDAIVAIDNDKHITVFNKQAEKFFGRTEAEMLGKRTSVLFEDVEVGRQIFDELDGGQSVSERQINFKHQNGEILPGKFSATVIKDEAGNAIGQAGFVRDLREINLLEARQRAWADVSQAVTMSQELDEILDLIMRSVTHIIPTATGGEFHLYKDGILQLAANTFHFSDEAISSFSLKVGEGIAGKVFATGQERIVKNTRTDTQFKAFDHAEAPIYRSMICVPLQVHKQILGTLTLTSEATNAFVKENVALLTPFASQAAIAIKNTQLLDEATKGLSTLKSISEASRNLISPQEPSEVLQTIVKQAKEVLQAWRASVILIGRDGSPHELAAIGYEHAPDVETVIRKRGGISARVMKSMEPCFIEDVTYSNEDLNIDMKRDGVLATACLPLKLGEEAIGVMWVQYQQPHLFTPTEKEALIIYSEQAALAYDKTRRMQELQHMRQAADALAGAADLPEVLTQIVSSARTVLNADSTAIWSYDEIREKFLLDYSIAEGIDTETWNQFIQEEPKIGQTADTIMKRGSITVENVANQKKYPFLGQSTRRLLKQIGIGSFQGIALTVGNERLGVLYINYNRPRRFRAEELETAATFADHAALALKKARLLEQVNRTQNAARIVAQVTALEESLEDTLNSVVKGMVKAVDCGAVTLYVYNHLTRKLHYPPAVKGLHFPEKTHILPDIPENSIVLKMLWCEEPYIVENTADDPDFNNRRFVLEEQIKSCVAIPLVVGSVRVGVLFVNYRQFHRFTHEELENIELFANQAAVAIRNAQLYEEVQERSEVRRALYKANEAISNSLLDEEATLHTILEQAVQITKRKSDNVGHACIREIENGISRLISVYPCDVKKKISQKIIKVSPEDYGKRLIGIMGRAALLEKPVRVGDVTKDADYLEVDPEVRSELAVPFRLGNAVIVINVEHKEKDAYDTIDEEALKVLASQAAIAIENAQLYQKSEIFREVAETLSRTNKLDDVLNVVVREAMKITDTHMGNITFWDAENEKASDALRVESDGKLHRYPSVARKNGNTRRIVDSRQALVIPDKRLEENPNPIYKSRSFLAEVGVPIENREKVLGVLYVRHPEPRHFPTRQVEMLKTLGKQAGVAIERAQTVGFIGNKTAVEWIQMASTAWGHSIKREVGIADGRLALLKAIVEQNNNAEFEAELINLKKVLIRIADIPITAPLSYEDGVKAVPVNDLLLTYFKRQWKHAQYKEISLKFNLHPDLDGVATVWASPEWLRRGFDLIVDNAVWAMKEANTSDPEISVTTCLEKSQISITLANNGPSISDEVLRYFRQEMAVPKKEGERGSGIGLQLTRTIFETYHGTMQINRKEGKGTEVVFTLPAYQPDKTEAA